MAGLHGIELQVFSYDTESYGFRSAFTQALYERYSPGNWATEAPEHLENLHLLHAWLGQLGVEATDLDTLNTRETDQGATHYRDLYGLMLHQLKPDFMLSYLDFLEQEVQPHFDERIIYQTVPTLRVHMPKNVAVGEYHNDARYGHPAEAVNFWVPATDAADSNTLHVQTSQDDQPQPVNVRYGDYVVFDGVNLYHGNKVNETGKTRISFDLRVVPESRFVPSDKASINTGRQFKVGEGGYYSILSDENLAELREKLRQESEPRRKWLEWLAEERRQPERPPRRSLFQRWRRGSR